MENNLFDVIVVGAGSGGLNIAGFFRRLNLKVLLIDKEAETIGGDCLNFGCVPSKALIHAARLARNAREATAYGLRVEGAVDMDAVRRSIVEKQEIFREHESVEYFRSLNITVVLGKASFVNKDTVSVGGVHYRGRVIVLATGSRPRHLSFPGSDQVKLWSNETIFENAALPSRFLVVGGGPIGLEIACAYEGFGSAVTVLDRGDRLLPKEDTEISKRLEEHLVKRGMTIHHRASIKEALSPTQFRVEIGGEEKTISADMVFVAIGRELNQDGLNLEAAGIALNERGTIDLDVSLRTTNPRVYVVGDLAGAHQFTHAAELHASCVIRNLLSPITSALHTDHMAWVTFTDPEVATFGRTSEELTKAGVPFTVAETSFEEDDRAITDEYRDGFVKVFLDKKGRLLGGTMMAPGAGELVQELMLAQVKKIPLTDLFAKVYPYPTASRINRRLAGSLLSSRLTERAKKILHGVFKVLH